MTVKFNYLKDPKLIYAKSKMLVNLDVDVSLLAPQIRPIALRMVHASANKDIVSTIAHSRYPVERGRESLNSNCNILCDCSMVKSAIIKSKLTSKNKILCFLDHENARTNAKKLNTTLSAGAVELWQPYLKNSVVLIANAPTALFHLLNGIINLSWDKPALIIGCPVGYVGAREAKDALIKHAKTFEYITVVGKTGGSAITGAAFNALTLGGEF